MIPMSIGGILMVAVTALGGAAGLFPVRRSLGPWAYYLLAFPVGLLGWTLVGSVTTILAIPWSPWVAAAGMASWAAALALFSWRGGGRGGGGGGGG